VATISDDDARCNGGASAVTLAWYSWFPGDFLNETRGWSALERGLYRELLDAQWAMGTLPASPADLRRIVSYTPSEWRRAWPTVERMGMFPLVPGGRQNPALERRRQQAINLRARRQAAGRQGNVVRWLRPRLAIAPGSPGESPGNRSAIAKGSPGDRKGIASTSTTTKREETPRNAGGAPNPNPVPNPNPKRAAR